MNRFRMMMAAGMVALGSLAMAADKVPDWLVGKYSGYSSYMKASFDLSITANGIVFGTTQIGDKKMYHVDGKYKHSALIIGQKIYGINRRGANIELVNEGNAKDIVDLKKTQ